MYKVTNISELIGLTLLSVKVSEDNDEILFHVDDGRTFRLYHSQDCCESVMVEDIAGDLEDLANSPIVRAEERISNENPDGVKPEYQDSFTWTFYELATNKGSVTIRWYGESNGYYSESVDCAWQ